MYRMSDPLCLLQQWQAQVVFGDSDYFWDSMWNNKYYLYFTDFLIILNCFYIFNVVRTANKIYFILIYLFQHIKNKLLSSDTWRVFYIEHCWVLWALKLSQLAHKGGTRLCLPPFSFIPSLKRFQRQQMFFLFPSLSYL